MAVLMTQARPNGLTRLEYTCYRDSRVGVLGAHRVYKSMARLPCHFKSMARLAHSSLHTCLYHQNMTSEYQ